MEWVYAAADPQPLVHGSDLTGDLGRRDALWTWPTQDSQWT